MAPDRKRAALAGLTNEQALALIYDWRFWARAEQLPPPGDWFVWLLRSGRGYGKTRTGAEWVISRAQAGFRRIALVGKTKADIRDTMVEVGDSGILHISPPWFMPVHEPTKRRLVWPNGAVAIFYSGDQPDQLRGPQHDSAWVDELAKFMYPEETWSNLLFGMRIGAAPQIVVTTTPRPIPLIKRLMAEPTTVDIQRPTWDNIDNLAPVYMREVVEPMKGTRLGRQELEGAILDDTPGALWMRWMIEHNRTREAPPMVRVVVAVDPGVATGESAAETGIVVVGVDAKHQGYVIADKTLRGSPSEWASQAVTAYYQFSADRIVAEANNGGDMVEHTVRTVDPRVSFRKVWASRGKYTRAEPVAALYEQGKVHHVGAYPDMEDQMCTWVPGEESPDRMDALVWGLTELMLGGRQYKKAGAARYA